MENKAKKSKKLYLLAAVLLLAVAVFAVIYSNSLESVEEQSILLQIGDKKETIPFSDLTVETVQGSRKNGKGEEIPVNGMGISLANLLKDRMEGAESYEVTVSSDDSYHAQVASDEVESAYLLQEEEELRLVVFGDSNSKRSVSGVKIITVEAEA